MRTAKDGCGLTQQRVCHLFLNRTFLKVDYNYLKFILFSFCGGNGTK
jgi:hypothetical protein